MPGILIGTRDIETSKGPALLECRVLTNRGSIILIQTGRPRSPFYHVTIAPSNEERMLPGIKLPPKGYLITVLFVRMDGWMDGRMGGNEWVGGGVNGWVGRGGGWGG